MANLSIKEALRSFTRIEVYILYLKCGNLKYEDIAEQMKYSTEWVQLHMSNTYAKLGFTKEMHWTSRVKVLKEEYCPALREMINDLKKEKSLKEDVEAFKFWPPGSLQPEVNPYAIQLVIEDKIRAERTEIEKVRPKVIDIAPPPPFPIPPPPPPIRWPIIVFSSLVIIFGCIAVSYLAYQLGTRAIIPAITQISPITQLAPITQIVLQPSSEPSMPLDTSPPQPTLVIPTATFLSSPTPLPILFEDNFDSGLNPYWQVISGKPIIVNGKLTASEDTWLYIGDETWVNYKVQYDSKADDCWTDSDDFNALGLRASGISKMIAFKYESCDGEWFLVNQGMWANVPNTYNRSLSTITHYSEFPISFIVQGESFSVSMFGETISSFISSDIKSGGIALRVDTEATVDNFQVFLLP